MPWIFISIQSTQDKVFRCLLCPVLFTIISIISSTIFKLHMGLVHFLNIIWLHEFIGVNAFLYFYCAGMSKQNHWEQRPMCSANNQVHRTRRVITLLKVTWVTDGGMLYQIVENEQKWGFIFCFDCFEDKHIDPLLQNVFYSSTWMWLITFLVDEYRWIFSGKLFFCNFYKFEGWGHNSFTVASGEIRASLIQ